MEVYMSNKNYKILFAALFSFLIVIAVFATGTFAEVPAIDIRKQAEGPDSRTINRGDDVTFEIAVTNTGDVDLTPTRAMSI
jgi:hypothetical protein